MVAYQAESDLIALPRPHYARVDQEGRTLLHELFATAGGIHVTNRELQITLAPLSSNSRRPRPLQDARPNGNHIPADGFAVRPPPRIDLAFPASPVERGYAMPCQEV
jgi:hypothetical protein